MKTHVAGWQWLRFSGVVLLVTAGLARPAQAVLPGTERAVAAGDWQAVLAAVATDEPVGKLLRAHAALAQNLNNEALCLFRQSARPAALEAWGRWTADFAGRFPNSPVAHYLRADAWARLRQWTQAGEAFDRALALSPADPLILNARGAAFAARRMWDAAMVDFDVAAAASPALADALANRGLVYLLQDNPGQWAETWLDRALDRSKDFAIALNARGAVRVARGDLNGAEQDFERARAACNCIALAVDNLLSVDILRIGARQASLQQVLASTEPGTELFSTISQQQQALFSARGQLTTAQMQLRSAADAGMGSLYANLNKAAIAQTVGDTLHVLGDALDGEHQALLRTGTRLSDTLATRIADQAREAARNQMATYEQANYNAVLANMEKFPNGPAAQQWAKMGITPKNFTLDVFRNPPPVQGGVAMGGTHIDTGHLPALVWLGLWYPPAAATR